MSRTGHSSTEGVRAYKRSTMQLSELTSDVLNQLPSTVKKTKIDSKSEIDGKENTLSTPSTSKQPIFNISGPV